MHAPYAVMPTHPPPPSPDPQMIYMYTSYSDRLTEVSILPYSDKRKQLLKMTFLVNEQNVSVMYIDIIAISLYLDWNIYQQDECFCSKLGMEEEYAKSNLKTSLSLIWVICELLPFVRVGQNRIQGWRDYLVLFLAQIFTVNCLRLFKLFWSIDAQNTCKLWGYCYSSIHSVYLSYWRCMQAVLCIHP